MKSVFRIGLGLIAGAALILAGPSFARAQDKSTPSAPTQLWVFLSPRQGNLTGEFETLRKVLEKKPQLQVRAALLTDDLDGAAHPSEVFTANLKALFAIPRLQQGAPFFDDEALALARQAGVSLLPAYVLDESVGARKRRLHVIQGKGARLEEILK